MRDARLDRLAEVLVGYSTEVRKGDVVGIMSEDEGRPLVEAVAEAVIRAGGHPIWVPRPTTFGEQLLAHGTDEQVSFTQPILLEYMTRVDVHIGLWAEANTKSLSRFDARRTALLQQARKPIAKVFMERTAAKKMRWCGTQYPTHAAAQDAEMSLAQYADFVFRAGLLHLPDPAGAWRQIRDRQERLREFLQGRRVVRMRAPAADGHDGTDLTVDVDPGKSVWINCAGKENFPDGEVFTGPQGADGHVNYTFPAVYMGREVEGVRLEFRGGKVVGATARKNEEFLHRMLDQDAGARTMGEIAIGTNYSITEFSRNTLFDEKIGGTFHAAVGAGYPESGNTNESGLHWDMVCDLRRGGTIEADGEVILRDGKFTRSEWPGE